MFRNLKQTNNIIILLLYNINLGFGFFPGQVNFALPIKLAKYEINGILVITV